MGLIYLGLGSSFSPPVILTEVAKADFVGASTLATNLAAAILGSLGKAAEAEAAARARARMRKSCIVRNWAGSKIWLKACTTDLGPVVFQCFFFCKLLSALWLALHHKM